MKAALVCGVLCYRASGCVPGSAELGNDTAGVRSCPFHTIGQFIVQRHAMDVAGRRSDIWLMLYTDFLYTVLVRFWSRDTLSLDYKLALLLSHRAGFTDTLSFILD